MDDLFESIADGIGKFAKDVSEGLRLTENPNRVRGKANYMQGQDLERYTEQQLEKSGFNANWDGSKLVYDETLKKFGKTTQVDVTIDDRDGNEVALIECKSLTSSQWNDEEQAQRLVYLSQERNIPLIFSTSDGTTDCFSPKVKEILNQTQCFVFSPDNVFFADQSDSQETGFIQGLPPQIQSYQESSDSGFSGLVNTFLGDIFGSSDTPTPETPSYDYTPNYDSPSYDNDTSGYDSGSDNDTSSYDYDSSSSDTSSYDSGGDGDSSGSDD